MRVPRTTVAACFAAVVILAGCTQGGSDDAEDGGAVVPSGWEAQVFDGGSVALPADWREQPASAGDELMAFGPERGAEPPLAVRVIAQEREDVPFDAAVELFVGGRFLEFGDFELVDRGEIDVASAQDAAVATFEYSAEYEGEVHPLRERAVVAWSGDDLQLIVRIGGPRSLHDEDADTIEAIIDSIELEG